MKHSDVPMQDGHCKSINIRQEQDRATVLICVHYLSGDTTRNANTGMSAVICQKEAVTSDLGDKVSVHCITSHHVTPHNALMSLHFVQPASVLTPDHYGSSHAMEMEGVKPSILHLATLQE
jgi:hypothetical protein